MANVPNPAITQIKKACSIPHNPNIILNIEPA
ncbi:unnamed protein product, partial [marine sediment metagenome]